MDFRIGQGYDVHQLVEGRPLIIGGVTIPYERGLLGHSDADVLLHAITVESTFMIANPASETRANASRNKTRLSAPENSASVSGK